MTIVFVIVGAMAGCALGWWWGRRVRTVPKAPPAGAPTAADRGERLVEHHPIGVVVAAPDGRVRFRNAAARKLQGTHVGVLVDEAIGRHVQLVAAQGESDEVLELFGPPEVALVVSARVDDGEVVVFLDDITERRRLDRVRTDFVANISHELKTPVGAMAVLAETLEGETDPHVAARVIGRITSEAHRAARTIDDLMELSRIESDGGQVRESVAVGAVLSGALDRVNEAAAQRGVGIAGLSDADDVGGVMLWGDRSQLVSALGNLVENAVKYSEPGGQVQVCTRVAGGMVEYAVTDQGVGIPAADLHRVFERFYRVDRARSRSTGGTGLGLSIVRHVAERHGGDVIVRSVEGEGSTFTLRVPVYDAADGTDSTLEADGDRGIA